MSTLVEMQTLLDAFKAARDMRLEEQRKVDALKKAETTMSDLIVDYLAENPELNGIIGGTHKAILKTSTAPIITDRAVLQEYVVANDAWDLINYQLSAPAMRERWDDEVEVLGTGTVQNTKLSVTKV